MATASPSTPAARSKSPTTSGLTLPLVGITAAILLIVVGALLAGRQNEVLPTTYGRRRGTDGAPSVNGTSVLVEFYKQAGHRVTTRNRLSPSVNEFDVIVWIPNDFEPPTKEQREFLEKWLAKGAGELRTVVYIGRDYDAAVAYWDDWEHLAPGAPQPQADEALRRRAETRATHEAARSKLPTDQYARWFTTHRDAPPRTINKLSGPWAEGIDTAKADLHLEGRLRIPSDGDRTSADPEIPDYFETLLSSGDASLVTRVKNDVLIDGWGEGQVLVIANGSFVLNYPLVNSENRKLAARLVNECGPAGRVVFIESGPGGPTVLDKEPAGGPPTPLELLKVWPLNAILLHLTILGIVLCLARSPIFGRPRELLPDSPADFGKHVAALGRLLARTKDRNYALSRLAQYRQIADRKTKTRGVSK
jgi:hypothetical protein